MQVMEDRISCPCPRWKIWKCGLDPDESSTHPEGRHILHIPAHTCTTTSTQSVGNPYINYSLFVKGSGSGVQILSPLRNLQLREEILDLTAKLEVERYRAPSSVIVRAPRFLGCSHGDSAMESVGGACSTAISRQVTLLVVTSATLVVTGALITSSNKKLLVTSATLVVTGALLVVTRSYWKQ